MKKLLLLSVLFIAFIAAKAQEPIFVKGDKVINLGIGLESWRLPITISGEYCIADGIVDKGSIGIGAYAGATLNWYAYYDKFDVIGGARGAFHYPFIEKLDTYAGISMGIDTWYTAYIRLGGFVGARYQLTEKLNVYGELGSGLGYLNVGISFKF
jgi:hypothetical protein